MSTTGPRPFSTPWVTEAIKRYGIVIIAVGSGRCSEPGCTGEHPITQPWSYTIGRVERGLPELVVYGLSLEAAHALLTHVDQHHRQAQPTEEDAVGEFNGTAFRLEPVPAWWVLTDEDPMGRWFAYYQGTGRLAAPPEVVQVVVADRQGRFPDDVDCDRHLRRVQPLLRDAPQPLPRRPSYRMPRIPGHSVRRHRPRPA